MEWHKTTLEVMTHGKGLYPFSEAIQRQLQNWQVQEGMCYLYIQHTSASLVVSENYDPDAKLDLESFMERLVPEGLPWLRHTLEGPDDSTSHIRSMLTPVSLAIPVEGGKLCLGTWQGVYLFEHRSVGHRRCVLLRCLAVGEEKNRAV